MAAQPAARLPSTITMTSSGSAFTAAGKQRLSANGASSCPKPQNESRRTAETLGETNTPDKHSHDRLLFLMATMIGCTATVTVKNGDRFTGIFSGASLEAAEAAYVLKMVRQLDVRTNGFSDTNNDYLGSGEDHAMVFDVRDVVDLVTSNVAATTPTSKVSNGSSFRTDADISGNLALRERELQRWEPTAENTIDVSLNGSGGSWDQFETNERLYGVKTDFDENMYTTSIDRAHPSYKQRAAAADRLAREIEGTPSTNPHIAEERNAIRRDSGMDEEERFSGVRRDLLSTGPVNSNRYTPPARRAPTGHATVHGAPVDPAIISSQLARPDIRPGRLQRSQSPLPLLPRNGSITDVATPVDTVAVSTDSGLEEPRPAIAKQQMDIERATEPSTVHKAVPSAQKHIPALNATTHVEVEVRDAFKSFAASEKLKIQELQRSSARRERDLKLNELKKFSTEFKLKTVVPTDIIGILAKDKQKQTEIVEKSQRQLEEQTARVSPTTEQIASRSNTSSKAEAAQNSSHAVVDRQSQRSGRTNQAAFNGHSARPDKSLQGPHAAALPSRPTGPGHLGQRLLAQQAQFRERGMPSFPQQMPIQDMRMVPPGPVASMNLNRSRAGSTLSTSAAMAARLNVQAIEFRPNPAATSFSPPPPSTGGVTRSPAGPKLPSVSRPLSKTSFFTGKGPRPLSQRKSIRDAFNPITRMKKEAETDRKSNDAVTVNGGIPFAYKTPPIWDCAEENKDKTYRDMFDNTPLPAPSLLVANGALSHQQQMPVHLQPGGPPLSRGHTPHQTPRHSHPALHHTYGRETHYDDHRMQFSSSNSSVLPSPRYQQPMLAYPSQMVGHLQPGFGQPVGQFTIGPNGQPMTQLRQYPVAQFNGAQGPHMVPPMMLNQPGGGPVMAVPMQPQMSMYLPGQAPFFPAHLPGPQMPGGYSAFGSPRLAPMMVQQGSQQGQPPQPVFYMSPSQHPQMYGQQQPPTMHMRGGMPMQQQHSFHGSPHLQYHIPVQHRGPHAVANIGFQHMHPNHVMSNQSQPLSNSMNHVVDQQEPK